MLWCEAGCCAAIAWKPNGENASDAELLVAMEAAPNKRSYRRLAAMRALLRGGREPRWRRFLVEASGW